MRASATRTQLLARRRIEVLRCQESKRAAASRTFTPHARGQMLLAPDGLPDESENLRECDARLAMNKPPIRILSVDDHPLLREGIATVIKEQADMTLVAELTNGQEAIQRFRECAPDITLMDLTLRDMSGIEAMVAIRSEFPDARFIILTAFDGDVPIQRALEAGAYAYLMKSIPPSELVETIRKVHAGEKTVPTDVAARLAPHIAGERLTTRETQVLRYIAGGEGNRTIAKKLFISEETVKTHIKHLLEKLRAGDRTQALAIALQRGFIEL